MKFLLLPFHLFRFWYLESLIFFSRSWKNSILFLEEELAVGLMWKLILVPLYHDSSIVGRILSVLFRLTRIFLGLFAFGLVSLLIAGAAIFWLGLPLLAVTNNFSPYSLIVCLSGVGLFLIHLFLHPHKTVWQVLKERPRPNVWHCSLVKKSQVPLSVLLTLYPVKNLLLYLEIDSVVFNSYLNVNFSDLTLIEETALILAKNTASKFVGPEHFFVATLKFLPNIQSFLLKYNLEIADFEACLEYFEKKGNFWRQVFIWDSDFAVHHLKGVNRGWLGVPTPNLDSYSTDLTRQAAKVGFQSIVGRGALLSEVTNILSQEENRNVCLVGAAGSGKTALVNFLAKQILAGDAPPALAIKRLVLLDLTKLLSNIKSQGELAARLEAIFSEVEFAQNIILVVEEIHNLGIGQAGEDFNLYSLLLPYLESADFQFIGTTEPENFSRILEKNSSFARLFTKIEVLPTNERETLLILEEKAIAIERKAPHLQVSFLALQKAVELSAKLIHDRVLPDSAISILQEATPQAKDGWITSKTVEEVLSKRVNVPVLELGNEDKDKLLNLEEEIHQELIDQVEAVAAVANTLRRSATGLREQNKPIGSFLFVGPTGVGKTELAKILARVYFRESITGDTGTTSTTGIKSGDTRDTSNSRGTFIRFDMSEFQAVDSLTRLIGSAGEGGLLTEPVRLKPYCLILLDEFEKASPNLLNLFLQVLDDGRLTDGAGRVIDFTNTIIIATSNAGSLEIVQGLQLGQTIEGLKPQIQQKLLTIFKPELVNRFDNIILFKPLSSEDLQRIVRLKLAVLQNQLKEQGYLVEFDESLVTTLANKGFDPILGARPLRRLIQDTLEARLSVMILENKLAKGSLFKAGSSLLV